jgi:CTP synthase
MQAACVEFARNVLGYDHANSTEFDPDTPHPVICDPFSPEDGEPVQRLGAYPCSLTPGSKLAQIYGQSGVRERHRHIYEFNNRYRGEFEGKGMAMAGISPDGQLVEAIELRDHPWFVGVQYHPEFKSRPNHAHPLYADFVRASKLFKERGAP